MNCRITRTIEALNATCARGFLPRACPFERRHPPSLPETSRFRGPRATYPFEADQRREESGGFVPPFADPRSLQKARRKTLFFSLSFTFFRLDFFFRVLFFFDPCLSFFNRKKKKKKIKPQTREETIGKKAFFFFLRDKKAGRKKGDFKTKESKKKRKNRKGKKNRRVSPFFFLKNLDLESGKTTRRI